MAYGVLPSWLARRGADAVAATALEAARAQRTALPGEDVAAQIIADLAVQILALDDRLKRIGKQIRETSRFYLKKRGEGRKHVRAVIALACRRAGVLWALLRDNRVFTSVPPVAQAA